MRRFLPLFIIIVVVLCFFRMFLFRGLLPIPADVMVGLYHPYYDFYGKEYPRGVPFKNVLLTDTTTQQYPWRFLSIDQMKQSKLPLWNPYTALGMPLLANQQSAVFYPLNILFFFMPFALSWSVLIVLSMILGGVFMYWYLRNLPLDSRSSLLGSLTFVFSGFFIAWLEWGTIPHVVLWTPLLLLSIDKINESDIFKNSRERHIHTLFWSGVFIFSLSASLFAGHIQSFFYVFVITLLYWGFRWIHYRRNRLRRSFFFCLILLITGLITVIQWYPTLQLISFSARDLNATMWQKGGWFLPWEHLAQFIAPDFFGNPATLNYWGVWNYAEFVGYIGIVPLIFVLFAMIFRHDRKTWFFTALGISALVFALPNYISKLPFVLNIPFISTAQPTRLLFVVDFSFAVLTALGFDYFLRERKRLFIPLGIISMLYAILWVATSVLPRPEIAFFGDRVAIARQNLILPGVLIAASWVTWFILRHVPKRQIIVYLFIILAAADMLRFASKYTPFVSKQFLYPETSSLKYLQEHAGFSRVMFVDKRILAPNIPVMFHLQSTEGYDPLLLRDYVDVTNAMGRNRPDIRPVKDFNRIVTPHEYENPITDLMNVTYIVSLDDLRHPKVKKVFEGEALKIYHNTNAYPRAFFAEQVLVKRNKQEVINSLFDKQQNLRKTAFVETDNTSLTSSYSSGSAKIISYTPDRVEIETENKDTGFLVLSDIYYPTWHAFIDKKETTIYKTDFLFRGVVVPKGKHRIVFSVNLF